MAWYNSHRPPSVLLTVGTYTGSKLYIITHLLLLIRWAGNAARMGDRRGVYWVLVGKREGKRPHGGPTRRWEDNIKMDLQKVGCRGMDRIELSRNRDRWPALVNAVMNLRVPYNAGNILTSWKYVSFSRSKYLLLLIIILLLEALQLQRSLSLLNEFLPFGPVSDAFFPVCYFHLCYVALYIVFPSIFRSS